MRIPNAALWPAMMAALLCASLAQPAMSAPTNDALGAISTVQGTPQRQAAERGLSDLTQHLMALPNPTTHIFAVKDYQALRNASIGAGFEVNLIEPQALLAGKSISASTYPSNEWRFMVMVDHQAVGLVTVARLHGQWKMVSAGASEMAKELAQIIAQHGQQNATRLRFIRSQQGVADLVEITGPNRDVPPRYVPLLSARLMLKQSTATAEASVAASAMTEGQLVPDLRASIQRGLSAPSLAH